LIPLGISKYPATKELGVPPRRINEIVHGSRSITQNTALRLAPYFGTTPHLWLNLQTDFDLRKLEQRGTLPPIRRCEKLVAGVSCKTRYFIEAKLEGTPNESQLSAPVL